ncbi:MAG: hypothetical protein K6G00_12060 [Treponema sp.]|nr:hypothetical protein [Treponema sp.]
MKKYVFASMIAACALFIAAAQELKRPELVTITGTVKVSGDVAVIVASDGKEYTLVTMDNHGGRPPAGKGDRPKGDGNPPPEPPKERSGSNRRGNPPSEGMPPEFVTKDELLMLDGKLVSVTGLIPDAGKKERADAPEPPAGEEMPAASKDGYFMIHSYEVVQY